MIASLFNPFVSYLSLFPPSRSVDGSVYLSRDRLSPPLRPSILEGLYALELVYNIHIYIYINTFFSRGANVACALVVSSNISYPFQNIDLTNPIAEGALGDRYLFLSGDEAKLKTTGVTINPPNLFCGRLLTLDVFGTCA